MIPVDIEIYPNYFLVGFKTPNGFEQISTTNYLSSNQIDKINNIMRNNITMGFNSIGYDLPVISYALEGRHVEEIKQYSDSIIEKSWNSVNYRQNPNWNHVDLMHDAPGKASLKAYGARMGMDIEESPVDFNKPLDRKEMRQVDLYNQQDLKVTERLAEDLKEAIELRKYMSKEYGIDLRSKSDAQMAESVFRKKFRKKPNVGKNINSFGKKFKVKIPDYIVFKDFSLNRLLKAIKNEYFSISKEGKLETPNFLIHPDDVLKTIKKKRPVQVTIDKKTYSLGLGGLHSNEENLIVKPKKGESFISADVSSYYPSIIINNNLFPPDIGPQFVESYKKIVNERLEAKAKGDKIKADTFKILINGSFGKLGSPYSLLYSPEMFVTVTMTGQLCLLMLIERLTNAGIEVVSGNTDGLFILTDKHEELREILDVWQVNTHLTLDLQSMKEMHITNVNNYIAIDSKGKVKTKGARFNITGDHLAKNPYANVCAEAVIEHIKTGKGIEDYIKECFDFKKFLLVRSVKGGALWNGNYVGKTVRWYWANGKIEPMVYKLTGNKVPLTEGCVPVQKMIDMPGDIDYNRYIEFAKEMLIK
jgi:hypothetical protein